MVNTSQKKSLSREHVRNTLMTMVICVYIISITNKGEAYFHFNYETFKSQLMVLNIQIVGVYLQIQKLHQLNNILVRNSSSVKVICLQLVYRKL